MSLTHPLPSPLPTSLSAALPAAVPRALPAQAAPYATCEHITLPRGATCTRRARAGSHLQVESGRAWVTLSGDTHDHFLTAGQHLPLPTGAVVVIEGDSSQPTRVRWR